MSGDKELVLLLAGCSLATSPGNKDNWVEKSGSGGKGGQLPEYICKIAKAVMRSGKSRSQAISIAVSRTKTWAAGGGNVNADTQAKAAKAVAQWEAMKAKNKANKLVKASREDGETYLMLSNIGDYSLSRVQDAWWAENQRLRQEARKAAAYKHGTSEYSEVVENEVPYGYIKEVWSNYLIVQYDEYGELPEIYKVPFTISGSDVTFGDAVEVESQWVEVPDSLDDNENDLLADILGV